MFEVVALSNGIKVLNTSAHSYKMSDGTVIPGNPEIAQVFKSQFIEKVVRTMNGVEFVESIATPTEEGIQWLKQFIQECPDVLVVTSFANLSAYKHSALIGFIATEETARSPMDQKVMRVDKFSQVLS